MSTKEIRGNIPVLVVGHSGTGKTSSTGAVFDMETYKVKQMGLPQDKVLFLNIEDKEMPQRKNEQAADEITIRNWVEYHYIMTTVANMFELAKQGRVKEATQLHNEFKSKYGISLEGKKFIVIDSFTALTDLIQTYCVAKFNNYDIWKNYAEFAKLAIKLMKMQQLQVFAFALPEQKDEALGQIKWYARVKGKEFRFGKVEAEFTIVLFTKLVNKPNSKKVDTVEFEFEVNEENTAKAPPGLFLPPLPNDLWEVYVSIREFFYGEKVEKWWNNDYIDKIEKDFKEMMEKKKQRRHSLRD